MLAKTCITPRKESQKTVFPWKRGRRQKEKRPQQPTTIRRDTQRTSSIRYSVTYVAQLLARLRSLRRGKAANYTVIRPASLSISSFRLSTCLGSAKLNHEQSLVNKTKLLSFAQGSRCKGNTEHLKNLPAKPFTPFKGHEHYHNVRQASKLGIRLQQCGNQ
jgi:hypothetical protein